MSCLLSSASFRTITPLWHAKEANKDHFQAEGIIVGWELYLKSEDEYIFSSHDITTTTPKVDFLDYSLGDRITTLARKFLKLNIFFFFFFCDLQYKPHNR